MLHNFAGKGECELLAVMSWANDESAVPAIYYGYKSDRHLLNHHFEHWKLLKCSKEARRNFKYPDDPRIDQLQLEAKKVEKVLDYICIFAFLCAIVIASLI